MAARGRIHSLKESNRVRAQIQFIDWWNQEWQARAVLPDHSVDLGGNVTVAVFQNVIYQLGLPYRDEYALREKPVIERLVEVRNRLAHGEWQAVELQEYSELQRKIDELMVCVCDDIETNAFSRRYRRG